MKNIFTIAAIFIILACTSTTTFAKTYKGYIMTKEGEKVNGKIKARNVTIDQVKITFITDGKKKTYKPKNIQGYGYEHLGENQFGETVYTWRHYRSKMAQSFAPRPFTSKHVFMEIMEEGDVTIYDYYVESPSDIKNPYKRFFYVERNGDNELIEFSKENFVTAAKSFFADAPELASKIGKINHRFRHAYRIVQLYNKQQKQTASKVDERFPF